MTAPDVRVLFFCADEAYANMIARILGPGFAIHCENPAEPTEWMPRLSSCDAVLVDSRSCGPDPTAGTLDLLQQIQSAPFFVAAIVLLDDVEHGMSARIIGAGAFDTVANPPDMVELRLSLRRAHRFRTVESELQRLSAQAHPPGAALDELIGGSEAMQQVFALVRKIAACDVTVLITGETGTGKELVARAIHRLSRRAQGPFVAFSCANLPETLVEDELFGHDRGAFTGAVGMRHGRFEAADQGTLFLDEVGDLAPGLQSKLLRVIQERTIERLGSNVSIPVNIRLVCATNRDLSEMVKSGQFREDLYYRLNVVQIALPALRERRDDIPLLAYHFRDHFAGQFGKKVHKFSRMALHALEEYDWPGNVRELENMVQRAVVLAEGTNVELSLLPARVRVGFRSVSPWASRSSYEDQVRDFKRRLILRTLQECEGCKAETARTLGVARGYLHRLINQLRIDASRPEQDPGPGGDSVSKVTNPPPKLLM